MSKVLYLGVEVDLAPASIKNWVEAQPRDDSVGEVGEGELCLVANYIRDRLDSVIVDLNDFNIWVDTGNIMIGDDPDMLMIQPDDELIAIIQRFDELVGAPTATHVLMHLDSVGVW